jgi:hypothetical protein
VLLVPTPDMHEMLYARSAIVTAVRAFGLESAIDAVTTIPKGAADDPDRLVRDCRNGKQFGFNGKRESGSVSLQLSWTLLLLLLLIPENERDFQPTS